jgi:uncharacterized protein (TIRG00374 family)
MKSKKHSWYFFRVAISIFAILIVLNFADIQKSLNTIKLARLELLLLSIFITFFEQLVIAYKWIILLKVKNFSISIWRLLNINLIASFWGLFLPSSLSIDVLRGYYLTKDDAGKALSASSIIVDRVMGILSLLFVAMVGAVISGSLLSGISIEFYIILFSCLIVSLGFIFLKEKTYLLITKFLTQKNNGFFEKISNLYTVVFDYKQFPMTLFFSFLLSVLIQIFRIVAIFYISEAFGLNIDIIYFFILVPITMITVMIPISVGGIGVREGSFIAFFSLVGLSFNDAVLISLTITLKVILFSLVGGILYLFYKPALQKQGSSLHEEN